MHTQKSTDASRLAAPLPRQRVRQAQPSPAQLEVLRLLSEQVAIPTDQLVRFLGCEEAVTLRLIRALEASGCVERGRFLVGRQPWVWLRHRGARLAGTGFDARAPGARLLRHRRAVNEVRLYLTQRAPEGRWICERTVYRQRDPADHIPDAIFEIGGERHAIEVELSPKPDRDLRLIIGAHSARYDAVIYFCGPGTRTLLNRISSAGNWPRLIVRDLPPGELGA